MFEEEMFRIMTPTMLKSVYDAFSAEICEFGVEPGEDEDGRDVWDDRKKIAALLLVMGVDVHEDLEW